MVSFNLGLKLSGVLICVLCLGMSLRRCRYRTQHLAGFAALTVDTLVSSIIAVIMSVYAAVPERIPNEQYLLAETFYALFHDIIGYLFVLYFLEVFGVRPDRKRGFYTICTIPVCILEILIIRNFFVRDIFFFESGIYMHGKGWIVLLLIPGIYFLIALVFILAYHKALPANTFGFLSLGFAVTIAGVIIQNVLGLFKIELFAESVTILMIMLTLENVERNVDFNTGVYSRKSLSDETRRLVTMDIHFTAVEVRILSKESGFGVLDDSEKEELNRMIGGALAGKFHIYQIFYYDNFYFVILLEKADEKEINNALTVIRECACGHWRLESGADVNVTASIIPIRVPEDAQGVDSLNSYLSWNTRNRAADAETKTRKADISSVYRSLLIEKAVQRGLQNHTIDASLQPIFDPAKGKCVFFEAFMRLHDPVLGDIPPGEIIPLAEQNGTIGRIERIILERCCETAERERIFPRGYTCIHLNISNYQLLDESMVADYNEILERHHLRPSMFAFEITEDEFIKQNPGSLKIIRELKDAGYHVILDNFGSSSMNIIEIMREKLDGIKVDRRVLWGTIQDSNRRMLLQTVISALKNNGQTVYQTGIETNEEAEFALECGCDYLQGYHYGAPMAESDLAQFLLMQEMSEESKQR